MPDPNKVRGVIVPDVTEYIELDQINGLISAAGKAGALDIIDAFKRSTLGLIDQLKAHHDAGAMQDGANVAHSIKGSAANIGASRIAETAQQIEVDFKSGETGQIPEMVSKMTDDFEQTLEKFSAHIAAFE